MINGTYTWPDGGSFIGQFNGGKGPNWDEGVYTGSDDIRERPTAPPH